MNTYAINSHSKVPEDSLIQGNNPAAFSSDSSISFSPLPTGESLAPVKSMRRKMKNSQAARAEFVPTPKASTTATVTTSSSSGILPAPILPPSKSPNYTTIPEGAKWRLLDPTSALMNYFEYLEGHASDPTAMMNLMNYLALLTSQNQLTPAMSSLLTNYANLLPNASGVGQGIEMWSNQMAQYAYFAGYNGQTGQSGMTNFLNDELAALTKIPNQNVFTQAMIHSINTRISEIQSFTTQHTDATTGDLTWTYDSGITYDWTNPGTSDFTDRQVIMTLINGQSANGSLNPFITGFNFLGMEQAYRVETLSQLLNSGQDPVTAITLWLLQSDDNQMEANVSGLNQNTDVLTTATNVFANDISDSITTFSSGQGDADSLMTFARAIFGAHVYFDQCPQLTAIQSQFDSNIFQGFNALGNGALGKDFIAAWNNPDARAPISKAVNDLFLSNNSAPNMELQTATNLSNQLSSLTSGQSKAISTKTSNDVSSINAVVKTSNAVLSMQKLYDDTIQHFKD